jgi:hypothetical protein
MTYINRANETNLFFLENDSKKQTIKTTTSYVLDEVMQNHIYGEQSKSSLRNSESKQTKGEGGFHLKKATNI